MSRIEHKAARFMVDLADALADVHSKKVGYGEFHVQEVPIYFDGEPTEYRLVFDGDGVVWIDAGDSP